MPINQFELTIIAEIERILAQADDAQITALVDAIMSARRVFVGGAGRSLLVMRTFAMRLMHLGVASHVVGETTTPAIVPGDLLLVGSGSGQTKTTLAIVDAARTRGALAGVITAHTGSPIARAADLVVEIHSPITDGVEAGMSSQPPGSLFEQSLFIHCEAMVMRLMGRLGTSEDEMRARHTKLE